GFGVAMHLGEALVPMSTMLLDMDVDRPKLGSLLIFQFFDADVADALGQFLASVERRHRNIVAPAKFDDGPIERPVVAPARLIFAFLQKLVFLVLVVAEAVKRLLKRTLKHLHADAESLVLGVEAFDDLQLHAMMGFAVVIFPDTDEIGFEK